MDTLDKDLTTTPVDIKSDLSLAVGTMYYIYNDSGAIVKLAEQSSAPASAAELKKSFPIYPKEDRYVVVGDSPIYAWVTRTTGHIVIGEAA